MLLLSPSLPTHPPSMSIFVSTWRNLPQWNTLAKALLLPTAAQIAVRSADLFLFLSLVSLNVTRAQVFPHLTRKEQEGR